MKASSVPDVKYRRFGMKRSTRVSPCVYVVDENRRLRLFERLLSTWCVEQRFCDQLISAPADASVFGYST